MFPEGKSHRVLCSEKSIPKPQIQFLGGRTYLLLLKGYGCQMDHFLEGFFVWEVIEFIVVMETFGKPGISEPRGSASQFLINWI